MSNNGDAPAMPVMDEHPEHGQHYGLTKREQFAMAAMQGMLSHSTRYKPREGASSNWHKAISEEAVQLADALLAELQLGSVHE